jgi:hypothetical protein
MQILRTILDLEIETHYVNRNIGIVSGHQLYILI